MDLNLREMFLDDRTKLFLLVSHLLHNPMFLQSLSLMRARSEDSRNSTAKLLGSTREVSC